MTRFMIAALVTCAFLTGCSIVLDPGHYQGGGGSDAGDSEQDGGSVDGGDVDVDASDDDAGSGDAGPSDAGDLDGGPICESGTSCAPAAPAGWEGPVVLVTGAGDAAPPSCPTNAPSTAFMTRSGMTAPEAVCGCACDAPSVAQMTCGATATLRTTSNCTLAGVAHATLTNGVCATLPNLPSSGFMTVARPTFSSSGTCTASPSVSRGAISWAAAHRGCGFGAAVSCGDSSACAPVRVAGQRLCVYADGDATCPAEFSEALATAESTTDGRGCAGCSCGSITGSCEGTVNITNACPGTLLYGSVNTGGCVSTSGVGTSRSATGTFTPSGSCTPSTATPTGDVTPTGVRTVCCLPE